MEDKIDLITTLKTLKSMKEELESRGITTIEYDNLQAIKFSINHLEKDLKNIRKRNKNNADTKENE